MHGSSASLIDSRFVVVKIDVGNFNKNLDLANRYGNPIQKGIPAAVVVTPADQVLYSTKAGELADARRMGERGIGVSMPSWEIDVVRPFVVGMVLQVKRFRLASPG